MSNKLIKNKPNCVDMNMNLYEYNKQGMNVYTPIDKNELQNRCKEINEKRTSDNYYMLYCRDLNDFTIFNFDNNSNEIFSSVLFECFENRGDVIDITQVEDKEGVFEIWLRYNNENYVYYFYPYSAAVLTVQGG